jgi:chromosome segregation protein
VHLKRLQLTGFKTFADRTEILFSPGVTAIVGPNGSGKSNIADAVLWVLGEQKASAVRGVRNQDVIFNGSTKRKQVGLAEVSLTVDNSDGTLPLAFDEVTITRRALRSGDSEYSINRTACRLKDLYELFLDTGVGREAYALVNQSEIDAVLTAAPESRRGLFEEAAGIKKYRVKKREALRKLETTELNLSRITDILTEVESQLAPLHVQSQLARRFLTLKEQLSRVEENFLITELRNADQQWFAAHQARENDENLAEAFTQQLISGEEALALTTSAADDAERDLEAFRINHQQIHAAYEKLIGERSLSQERVQALTVQAELHKRELADLVPRLQAAIDQIASLEAETQETGQQAGDRHKLQSDSEIKLRQLTEEIRALQTADEKRRKDNEAVARRRASEEGELARAEARLSEAEASVLLVKDENQRVSQELSTCTQALKTAEDTRVKAESALADAVSNAATQRELKSQRTKKVAKARLEHESIRGEGLSISVRLKSLQGLEDSQEGYFAGVKSVITASKDGRLPGRYLVVADSFSAPQYLVTALDTAFGSSLQDIITDTEHEAKAAIEFLKRGSFGRATFLPLQRMRNNRADARLAPGNKNDGYLGAALDLIEFNRELRPALEALIGRVLICETLDHAFALSSTAIGWSRIVTVSGEIVVPSGAITGGSNQRRGSSLLERKTDIQRLTVELAEQKAAEDRALEQLSAASEQLSAADDALNRANERHSELRLQVSVALQSLDRAKRDLMSAADRSGVQSRRSESAMETVRQADNRVTTCRELLSTLYDLPSTETTFEESDQLRTLMTEREEVSAQITQERITRATLDEKSAGLTRALRLARAEVEQLTHRQATRIGQIERVEKDRASLVAQIDSLSKAIDSSALSAEEADRTLQVLQDRRHSLFSEAAAAAASIRELQNARAGVLAAVRKSELAEARYEIVRQQAALKLLEEYDVTAEHALSLEADPEVTADSPREVARLRRELRALGDVNVSSVEEFDRLSERFAHMTAQKTDAEIAKDKVREAIREIDESTRDVFMATFQAVEIAFQNVFERMFNGGRAELKLTEPGDLLETGVDILVQLPGKKQQNLNLLSGGERALTAVSLLFAFLKVRPAPFCLLDEVDAPLDGANIERFADLLQEFGDSTQFLVITHNPATMEAANVWYGVTMQEPGVSRVLSLQVPEPLNLSSALREKIHN